MVKVNDVYTLKIGFYAGQPFIVTWISNHKNIYMSGERYTQVHGILINSKKRINTVLEFLSSEKILDYKKMSKLDLIKRAKKYKDVRAKKEYIMRFKKPLKI
jgi:ribosomal protein L4